MTTQQELCEWLDEEYPESIIRIWDDGVVEFAINAPDMEGTYDFEDEDLPGRWITDNVMFGKHGVSFHFVKPEIPSSDRELAAWLHEQYEEIAAKVGWETQDGTSVDFDDLPEENRVVMLELANRINRSRDEKRSPNAKIYDPSDNQETPR